MVAKQHLVVALLFFDCLTELWMNWMNSYLARTVMFRRITVFFLQYYLFINNLGIFIGVATGF